MKAIAQARRREFLDRMVRHLLDQFPNELQDLGIRSGDLNTFVRDGVARAESYGVTGDADIRLFLECQILLAPDFDTSDAYPWARDILRRPSLTGLSKMTLIANYLTFGDVTG